MRCVMAASGIGKCSATVVPSPGRTSMWSDPPCIAIVSLAPRNAASRAVFAVATESSVTAIRTRPARRVAANNTRPQDGSRNAQPTT